MSFHSIFSVFFSASKFLFSAKQYNRTNSGSVRVSNYPYKLLHKLENKNSRSVCLIRYNTQQKKKYTQRAIDTTNCKQQYVSISIPERKIDDGSLMKHWSE